MSLTTSHVASGGSTHGSHGHSLGGRAELEDVARSHATSQYTRDEPSGGELHSAMRCLDFATSDAAGGSSTEGSHSLDRCGVATMLALRLWRIQ
jgi:hypothetical protein